MPLIQVEHTHPFYGYPVMSHKRVDNDNNPLSNVGEDKCDAKAHIVAFAFFRVDKWK